MLVAAADVVVSADEDSEAVEEVLVDEHADSVRTAAAARPAAVIVVR